MRRSWTLPELSCSTLIGVPTCTVVLLAQGWTLLGISCPKEGCFTPFVRNKQGQLYCVNCEQFAVTEEEAQKQREQQEQLEKQREEELAAQAAKEQQEREQRIHQLFREEEQRKAAEAQQLERARSAAQASGSGTLCARCATVSSGCVLSRGLDGCSEAQERAGAAGLAIRRRPSERAPTPSARGALPGGAPFFLPLTRSVLYRSLPARSHLGIVRMEELLAT